MKKYRIALYIRLSLEDAKTDSMSISSQRNILREYASELPEYANAELTEFVDNGYSGANFERPAVQELLDLVRANRIDCIMVKDFSRFGRNSLETGYFIERVFPLFHTRFISVNDDFDTQKLKGDTGGMEVAFKYLISEYYSHDMSVKTKTAKYLKFQRGEYQSKICPYGYRKGENGGTEPSAQNIFSLYDIFGQKLFSDVGNIAADKPNRPCMESIKEIYKIGRGPSSSHTIGPERACKRLKELYPNATDIARELSRQQIPTPGEHKARKGIKTHDVSRTHGMWCNSTVLRILADERYMGTYVIGKREVTEIGGHKMRSKAESDWIKIPDHHIPLVNEEIFSKANASIQRFKIPNRKKHDYLLRGKVICGCCKHALHLANGTSYRCRFSSTIPSLDCYNIHIREKELNQLVYELLCKQFQVAFGIDSLADLRKVDTVAIRQADFDRQIVEMQEEKRKLYEALVSGRIPLLEYKDQKEQISEKLLEVQNTKAVVMARLEAEQEERQHQRQQMDISRMLTESDGLTSELVDLLIDKIYVYPDKRVDIAFKIRDSFTTHD